MSLPDRTPKEIRDDLTDTAVPVRGDVAHLSQSNNESIGVLNEDISRLQGAFHEYSAALTYDLDDEVIFENILYLNIVAITVGETFNPIKWKSISPNVDSPFGGFGNYQNFIRFSEDFGNVEWQKLNGVDTALSTTPAPNGTLTAYELDWANGATNALGYRQTINTVDSETYTVSFWAQHTFGNTILSFRLHDGTLKDFTIDSTTFKRYSGTITAGTGANHIDIENTAVGGGFLVWGLQIVDGDGVDLPYSKTDGDAVEAGVGATVSEQVNISGIPEKKRNATTKEFVDTQNGYTPTEGARVASTGNVPLVLNVVQGIEMQFSGTGYTDNESVDIVSALSGINATGDALVIVSTSIDSVTITNGGSGYAENEVVTLENGGTGATGFVQVLPITIDGVPLVAGDTILLKDQTDPTENGIYVVDSTLVRTDDANSEAELNESSVFIKEGTVNGGKTFLQTANIVTLDTTIPVYEEPDAIGVIGDGLELTGSKLSVAGNHAFLDEIQEFTEVNTFTRNIVTDEAIVTPNSGIGKNQNLVRFSNDFTDAVWSTPSNNAEATLINTVRAPNGTSPVSRLEWLGGGGLGFRQQMLGIIPGDIHTVSFWAKFISGASNILRLDLGDGVGSGDIPIDSDTFRRYSVVLTAGGSNDFVDVNLTGANDSVFLMWGFQVVKDKSLLPFIQTTDNQRGITNSALLNGTLSLNAEQVKDKRYTDTQNGFTSTDGAYVASTENISFATVTGGLKSVTIEDGGVGYTQGASVTLTGADSSANNAVATSNVDDGTIDDTGVIGGTITGYTQGELVTLTGAGNDDATAQILKANGVITSLDALVGGSGYTDGELITLEGTGTLATATAVILGGIIQSVTLVTGGRNYTVDETLTIRGVTSDVTTASIDVDTTADSAIRNINILKPGSGYAETDVTTMVGQTSGVNTATIVVDTVIDGVITSVSITGVGSGYQGNEVINITGDGSGADGIAIIDASPSVVDTITLLDDDTILLKDQTVPDENGIYNVVLSGQPNTWTRIPNPITTAALNKSSVFIEQGAVSAGFTFLQTAVISNAVNDDKVYELADSIGQIGTGLELTGTVLSVDQSQPARVLDFDDTRAYAEKELILQDNLTYRNIIPVAASGGTPFDVDDWIPVGGLGVKNVKHIFSESDFPPVETINSVSFHPLDNNTEYVIAKPFTVSDGLFIDAGFKVLMRSFSTETNVLTFTPSGGGALFNTLDFDGSFTGVANAGTGEIQLTGMDTTNLQVGRHININQTSATTTVDYSQLAAEIVSVDSVSTLTVKSSVAFIQTESGDWDNKARLLELERATFDNIGTGSSSFITATFTRFKTSEFFMFHCEAENFDIFGAVVNCNIAIYALNEFENINDAVKLTSCESVLIDSNNWRGTQGAAMQLIQIDDNVGESIVNVNNNNLFTTGTDTNAINVGSITDTSSVIVTNNIDLNPDAGSLFSNLDETDPRLIVKHNVNQRDSGLIEIDIIKTDTLDRVTTLRPFLTPLKIADPPVDLDGNGNGVGWSPDGRFLAIAEAVTPFITIYELNGTVLTKVPTSKISPEPLPGTGHSISWSINGQFLAVGHSVSDFVIVYERKGRSFTEISGGLSATPTGAGRGVAFSPNNRFLGVAHATTPFISIYEMEGDSGTKLSTPAVEPAGDGNGITFSQNGQFLAVAHFTSPHITIYSITGNLFTGLLGELEAVNISDGGGLYQNGESLTITGQNSGANGATATAVVTLGPGPLEAVNISDGDTGYQNGEDLTILGGTSGVSDAVSTAESTGGIRENQDPGSTGRSIAFSPDGQFLAVGVATGNRIAIYQLQSDGITFLKIPNIPDINYSGETFGITWSPNGKILGAAIGAFPFVIFYERETVDSTTFVRLDDVATEPSGNGNAIAFSPNSEFVAIGNTDLSTTQFIAVYQSLGLIPRFGNISYTSKDKFSNS